MHDPLEIVNTLQKVLIDAGLHKDLGLPHIAVVGSQSAGKSSVLQSIVGRDFLPCGAGIVTRRPLILQLRNTAVPHAGSAGLGAAAAEWAEFAHRANEQFTSFDQVRVEIESEMRRLCSDHQGVSDEPILLQIFSPSVLDLTLVDLPGLTKVPTGDQPSDISERIQNLVLRYISQKSCLILAVSAANTDLATSDALALARQVDPLGERTLGVLTKLDLADDSGSALKALSGKVYTLRLGYVGVACRSEESSKRGVTFEGSVEAEKDFLKRTRSLRTVADHCGIPHLARRLHELLLVHVREALPILRAQVQGMAEETKLELDAFGDTSLEQRMEQKAFLLHVLEGYVRNFTDALQGRLPYEFQEQLPDKLVGGARLQYIFHRVFAQAVLDFDAIHGLTDLEIRVAMRNAVGPKPQLFVPDVAFEMLVKKQISKLREPSLQCVQLVYEELNNLATQSEMPEMQRFPALRGKVLEVVQTVIKKCVQPANQHVSNLIHIELAHINIAHPDFIGGLRAWSAVQTEHSFKAPLAELESVLAKFTPREDSLTTSGGNQESVSALLDGGEIDEAVLKRSVSMPGGSLPIHKTALKRSVSTPLESLPISSGAEKASQAGTSAGSASMTATGSGQRRSRWGDVLRYPTLSKTLRLPAVPLVVVPPSEPLEKEQLDTELLKSLISSYFHIVKKKLIDAVPKAIMHFLVNAVRDTLLNECIAELYRNDLCAALLTEAEDVRQRGRELVRKLAQLRNILQVFAEVRDIPHESSPSSRALLHKKLTKF